MGNESSTISNIQEEVRSYTQSPADYLEQDDNDLEDTSSTLIVSTLPSLPEGSSVDSEDDLISCTHLDEIKVSEDDIIHTYITAEPLQDPPPTLPTVMPSTKIDYDVEDGDCDQQEDSQPTHSVMMQPLIHIPSSSSSSTYANQHSPIKHTPSDLLRSRKGSKSDPDLLSTQQHVLMMTKLNPTARNGHATILPITSVDVFSSGRESRLRKCWYHSVHFYRELVKNTLVCMNILAKILFWISLLCLMAGVVWYSMELHKYGYVLI